MAWIVFEAVLALAVMLAAAWWTFGSRHEPAADDEARPGEAPSEASTDAPADR